MGDGALNSSDQEKVFIGKQGSYGSKIDLSRMKSINCIQILEEVRKEGPISRADLAKRSKLSPPTVSALVERLMELKLLYELQDDGRRSAGRGRRPTMLKFNQRFGYAVGVEILPLRLRLAVSDLNGRIVARQEQRTQSNRPEHLIEAIERHVRRLMKESGLGTQSLLSVGIAVPGITDSDNGIVIDASMNLDSWLHVPLRALLEERLEASVALENDMNAAAAGEHWRGCAQEERNFIYFSVRPFHVPSQMGAGIILDGDLLRGGNWYAGEIGRIRMDFREWQSKEDRLGDRIDRQMPSAVEALQEAGIPLDEAAQRRGPDLELVFEAVRQGSPKAQAVIDELALYLGTAVANIASILDPTLVVFGGSIAQVGQPILGPIRRVVSTLAPNHPRMSLSTLGDDAQLFGSIHSALKLAQESLHQRVLEAASA